MPTNKTNTEDKSQKDYQQEILRKHDDRQRLLNQEEQYRAYEAVNGENWKTGWEPDWDKH